MKKLILALFILTGIAYAQPYSPIKPIKDTLTVHGTKINWIIDTTQVLRTDIGLNKDSLTAHNLRILVHDDSLVIHRDSVEALSTRSRANNIIILAHNDSLVIYRDSVEALSTRSKANQDSSIVFSTRTLVNQDSVGALSTRSKANQDSAIVFSARTLASDDSITQHRNEIILVKSNISTLTGDSTRVHPFFMYSPQEGEKVLCFQAPSNIFITSVAGSVESGTLTFNIYADAIKYDSTPEIAVFDVETDHKELTTTTVSPFAITGEGRITIDYYVWVEIIELAEAAPTEISLTIYYSIQ